MKYAIIALICIDTIFANTYEHIFFWLDPWDAFAVSMLVRMFVVTFFVMWLIPYKHLLVKSAAFIYSLSYAFDIIQYLFVHDRLLPYAVGLSFFVFIPWLFYAWFRSYEVTSDKLEPGVVYFAAHKPDTFLGFMLSLITERPLGGSGVLVNDTVYMYRHGVFRKHRLSVMPDCVVYTKSSIKADSETIEYLEGMVGKSWQPWRNCLTMKARMFHHAGQAR